MLTTEDKKRIAAASATLSDGELAHRHDQALREVVHVSIGSTTKRMEETCRAAGKARGESEGADKEKDVNLRDAFEKVRGTDNVEVIEQAVQAAGKLVTLKASKHGMRLRTILKR